MTDLRAAMIDGVIEDYRVPFLTHLRSHVDELVVGACRISNETSRRLTDAGVRVELLPFKQAPRSWRHPAGFVEKNPLMLSMHVDPVLRRARPNVVVSGDLGLRSLQSAAYCYRTQVPLVLWARLSEHSELGRSRLQRQFRPWVARQAQRIVVNGASGRNYLRSLHVGDARVAVVHQALNPAAIGGRVRCASHDGPVRLVFVGRLVPGKGLHHLINAADQVPPDAWHLTVVGDGRVRPELEAEAARRGLPISFVGRQPAAEVARHLTQADFLVHPSLSDEWGLVISEALANGVPVIGSVYAQAQNELVREGWNGWSFRPDLEGDVARVLNLAVSTRGQTWTTMSANARASAAHLWPDRIATCYAAVLAEAAATARRRRSSPAGGVRNDVEAAQAVPRINGSRG